MIMSLRNCGYEKTESECTECENGVMFVNSFELVCGECHTVVRKKNNRTESEEFYFRNGDPDTYEKSGIVKNPGGFEWAYYGDGIYGD